MSSPYPLGGHRSRHADENPTILTIHRAESADANGSRSIFGENAGRLSFGSAHTERSRFGKAEIVTNAEIVGFANAEKSGFGKVESSTFRESTEKSRLGEDENPEFGTSGEKSGLHRAEDVELEANGEKLKGFGAGGSGAGSGVGGKLRSSRRGNKRTPYDRPVIGRHATAGGSAAMAAGSLPSTKHTVASRLRDSASRFIHSSASYVFSALFKRAPPSIKANGESTLPGVSSAVEEEICKEMLKAPAKQNDPTIVPASQVRPLVDAGGKLTEAEGRVLDIVQVEEILKQKTWSREQVNRLTRILQTRVSENDAANAIVEAEKTEEQPKTETKDSSPVQVARAYMGEQATRPSGIAATVRKSTLLSTEVQPSPVRTLVEDRYLSSPFSRNWTRSSASVRIPKRSLAREDDLASMGPVRRVRQKTSMLTNASPFSYSSRMAGFSKPSETRTSSPPSQSSQTALKILETLEKLSPSPQGKFLEASAEKSATGLRVLEKFSPTHKGKFLNEIVGVAGTSASEQTPETSKAREKMLVQNLGSVSAPKSTESKLIGKVTFGGMNFNNAEAVKKSVVEAPSSISKSHNIAPVLGKGFRMNAVFEESNSDEEAKLQAKRHASSEARDRAAPLNLKEEVTATPASLVVSSTAADLFESFLPAEPVQASSSSVLILKSRSPPATPSLPDKPEPFVTAVSQERLVTFPGFSFPPVAVETRSILPSEIASSPAAAAAVSLSVEKVLRVPNSAGSKPASPSIFARPTEALETTAASTTVTSLSTSSEFTITGLPISASVGTTAPASLGNPSIDAVNVFSSPVPTTSKTVVTLMELPEVENAVTMATESPGADKQAEVDTMATDSMAEEADTSNVASPASPMPVFLFNANVQPSTASTFSFGGVSSTSSSAVTFPFGGGLGTASTGASVSSSSAPSFVFGSQSSTVSAGQAPNSLMGVSASFPSATAFTFGGQSSTLSVGQVSGASALSSSSPSSFAFGGQSGTIPAGQAPSFVAKPSGLFDQSGTGSTGQAPAFGALPSSPANPFSSTAGNLSSPFMFGASTAAAFGSSAVSSTPSVFTSSSSGVPSFGGSSTFQFGAPAMSSALTSASSMSSTTNSFTTSPFSSSTAPTLSATPTFSFGANAASSSSAGSAPSGQPFAFGAAQSNPFAANPFSSSGTQNPGSAFNFVAPAMAATPSPFSSSGSPASMFASNAAPNTSNIFAFGSTSTPNPSSPFAFGSGQPAPVQAPTPAPFGFGGQPAAVPPASGQPYGFGGGQPAPNPFSAAGTTQPGPEFAGGFALGATSGDKSGRKFIKAKRMGSTKRGK